MQPQRDHVRCAGQQSAECLETTTRSAAGKPFRVVTCAACSLRYTDPLPTAEEFNRLYEDEYYEYALPGSGEDRTVINEKSSAGSSGWLVSERSHTYSKPCFSPNDGVHCSVVSQGGS